MAERLNGHYRLAPGRFGALFSDQGREPMTVDSVLTGFYKLPIAERVKVLQDRAGLTAEEAELYLTPGRGLSLEQADRIIENVVGVFPMPLGVAVNFLINGRDYLVPMALEEPSVVAAASHAAKLARLGGGFRTSSTPPIMIGQIQVVDLPDPHSAAHRVLTAEKPLIEKANSLDPMLVNAGGGALHIQTRVIDTLAGKMLIVELLVDCRDAMGANAVNTMAEALAPDIEQLTGGQVLLRIISNLAVHRLARASAVWTKESLGGEEVVDRIVKAYAFGAADPFRCATHNKGIMNGIDAVVIATGNDFRAVEAGAHAYAARTGRYTTLTHYEKDREGSLHGSIELPMAVGTIGGAVKVNPMARLSLKLLGVKSAAELAEVIAAVGLAQNFAALRALSTEGIQRGHMSLHARNIAATAGAPTELIDVVAERMVRERKIRIDRAKEILEELTKRK